MPLISYVTKIQFGYDSLQQLAVEAERAGITRPLILAYAMPALSTKSLPASQPIVP